MRRLVVVIAVIVLAVACGDGIGELGAGDPVNGQQLFTMNCVACHGTGATGTANGPPLVHPLYEPGTFPDRAIADATRNGAPQRHWSYGRMPGIGGLSDQDLADLIAYIRQLQADAGLTG